MPAMPEPLVTPLTAILPLAKIASLMVTPIAALACADALLGVMKPDTFEPELAPKVLSSIMVPGNTIALVPIDPGSILDPEDLAIKLIAKLEVLVAIVKLPVVIVEFKLPVVVSKVMLASAPLVLAAKVRAPIWLISLLDVKLILEPLRAVIVPDW